MSELITCYLCEMACRWENAFDHRGEELCGVCYERELEKENS